MTDEAGSALYVIQSVHRVHDTLFQAVLLRVDWGEGHALPPQTVAVDYSDPAAVPMVGSHMRVSVSSQPESKGG